MTKTIKEEILGFEQSTEQLTRDQLSALTEALGALEALKVDANSRNAVWDLKIQFEANVRASRYWARAICDRLSAASLLTRDEQTVLSRIASELLGALEEINDLHEEILQARTLQKP
jgi:hypothetical protein